MASASESPRVAASLDDLSTVVHLRPDSHSDLVLHYRGASWHVHRFVLHEQSGYFRALLSSTVDLANEEDVEGSIHQLNTDVRLPSSPRTRTNITCCRHASPAGVKSCLSLPDQCGLKPVGSSIFSLFLQHLYFSTLLHLPPAQPKVGILEALDSKPLVALGFPSLPVDKTAIDAYAAVDLAGSRCWSEALLSLFHYFDCQSAIRRCEQVIAWDVASSSMNAWRWLPVAARYGLNSVVERCIENITSSKTVPSTQQNAELRKLLQDEWSTIKPELTWRVLLAMSR